MDSKEYSAHIYSIMTWHHPNYYKELERIRKEEERKDRNKKALTKADNSDIVQRQDKESISDCLE